MFSVWKQASASPFLGREVKRVEANLPQLTYAWSIANLQNRFQWDNNGGYCGETSTIMAGLTLGQYFSQYDMRLLSMNDTPLQQTQVKGEYLLGINDETAAKSIKLNYIINNRSDTSTSHAQNFLAWVKKMVRLGYPTTIAVYWQGLRDSEYDHIIPVHSIQSNYNDDLYHDTDIITFQDNYVAKLISYSFAYFPATRTEANARPSDELSLPSTARICNYGIAHTSPYDTKGALLKVRMAVDVNNETPVIKEGSNTRPAAMTYKLTITVEGVETGVLYNLYKYNNEASIPSANFNSASASATRTNFIGAAPTFVKTEIIQSSEKAIYRCVRADSP